MPCAAAARPVIPSGRLSPRFLRCHSCPGALDHHLAYKGVAEDATGATRVVWGHGSADASPRGHAPLWLWWGCWIDSDAATSWWGPRHRTLLWLDAVGLTPLAPAAYNLAGANWDRTGGPLHAGADAQRHDGRPTNDDAAGSPCRSSHYDDWRSTAPRGFRPAAGDGPGRHAGPWASIANAGRHGADADVPDAGRATAPASSPHAGARLPHTWPGRPPPGSAASTTAGAIAVGAHRARGQGSSASTRPIPDRQRWRLTAALLAE
mmetsp:Transcript_123926/g.264242  ORF Transcript_123926/g.264242 Transcript_123926/m.264242 type:complete len:264 (-) Transcript_123926:89-880(-)